MTQPSARRRATRAPATRADFRWIPVRALSERHRPRILEHLLSLGENDRYLRFGFAASDDQVRRYVERIDFARDEVFGIFNRRLVLIATAHLAYLKGEVAEFGVSVLPQARGRGFGARLFDRAVLHARNRGVERLVIHALTENAAMLHIARKAGASVERHGPEAQAQLKLPRVSLASQVGELVEHNAGEFDYQVKKQVRRMDALLSAIAELRHSMGESPLARE